jgi:DnaK suppressor protein
MSTPATVPEPRPSPAAYTQIHAALEARRDELTRQLSELDQTPSSELGPVGAAHRETLRSILTDVEAALDRLATGHYGRCRGCDRTIPDERLALVPHTQYCVGCAAGQPAR